MRYLFIASGVLTVAGLAVQLASIAVSRANATSFEMRLVTTNEYTLFWCGVTGIFISWTTLHLTAKAFQPEYTGSTARNLKMGKFVLGVRTRVILWSINVATTFTIALATVALLFKQADHQLPVWALFIYLLPILASTIMLPVIYKECLAKNVMVEELVDSLVAPHEHGLDDVPISSYMTLKTGRSLSPKAWPATIVGSGSTKFSMYPGQFSPNVRQHACSPPQMRAIRELESEISGSEYYPNSPLSMPSHISSDEENPRLSARIGQALLSVAECSILASAISVLSVILCILLLTSASRQHQYSIHTPLIYGRSASELVPMHSYANHSPRVDVFCAGSQQNHKKGGILAPQHATLLIEHPIGYPSLVVRSLQRYFVEHGRRVCIYDRPGYMASPLGYAPMSPEAVHKALGQELDAIGEFGPFYVIGVDSGSEFAMLFPRDDHVSTIGMALIRPTQLGVAGLLANGTMAERMVLAKIMIRQEVLATNHQYSLEALDGFRMLAAISLLSSGVPAEATIHESDHALAEWAFANPNLVQTQYFEQMKIGMLMDAIEEPPRNDSAKIPVAVFGLALDAQRRGLFTRLVSNIFDIEMSESNSDKPLTLTTISEQISWHIQRMH